VQWLLHGRGQKWRHEPKRSEKLAPKKTPKPVWDFTIGGYQVIKKWLSYREQRVLGRVLTMAEIMEVTAMARRLAALVLLQPRLDENYQAVAAATWAQPAA